MATKRRLQEGGIFFDAIDQWWYYDEGLHLRYVEWKDEREASPMHQNLERRPLVKRWKTDKAAAPMHQEVKL